MMVAAGFPRMAGAGWGQVGAGQFDFVQAFSPLEASTTSTRTANVAYLSRVRVTKPITVTQMAYGIGAAAGTVDMGIYTSNGTQWVRQASTGPIAAAGSNVVQAINLTAPYTMQPGVDYWLAYLPSDGTTQTCLRSGAVLGPANAYKNQFVSQGIGAATLPSTITIAGASGAPVPWLAAA